MKTKCLSVKWEGRAHCQTCSVRADNLCADVDVVEFEPVLRLIQQYCYPAGKLLYAEGVAATDIFVVRKGLLKLEEVLHDGSQRIVRLVESGHVAGIECLLDHAQRYEHSAIALQDSEVCQIPYAVMQKITLHEPAFSETIMEHWHSQILASEQVIVDFSTGTVRERVARIMLKLINLAEQDGEKEIQLPSVRDMSGLTGVTRESISRVMADFKRSGLLTKIASGRVKYDLEGLQALADPEPED